MCAARGMAPMVTLHHFTHPNWLGEEFWLRPGSPDVFARHVRRVLPALVPHCRHWVTINEPNIVMLMGWVEGAAPPGRRMAISDAYCVLDNLLAAHVLAADAIAELQPDAEVTMNTSSSSIYEHDRMLVDLLRWREAGIDPSDVDRYVDERRAVARRRLPAASRRGGGVAPVLRHRVALRHRPPARSRRSLERVARPSAPRRRRAACLDVVAASPRPRVLDAAGFDWYDPVASHALRRPGRRSRRRARLDLRARPVGHRVEPGRPGVVVRHGGGPAPRPAAVGGRERDGDPWRTAAAGPTAWTGRATCASTWVRWPTPWRPECRCGPTCTGRSSTTTSGAATSRASGCSAWSGRDPDTVRWMDTDAAGSDAAGAFTAVVAGLRRGDRSVLEPG